MGNCEFPLAGKIGLPLTANTRAGRFAASRHSSNRPTAALPPTKLAAQLTVQRTFFAAMKTGAFIAA